MNANGLAKHYDKLTPGERFVSPTRKRGCALLARRANGERFRLILAASSRGDMEDYDRLVRAAGTLNYPFSDHWHLAPEKPFAASGPGTK